MTDAAPHRLAYVQGRSSHAVAAVVLAAVGLPSSGCAISSLAASTGPRSSGDWSVARRQVAQVGETVDFDLVLRDPWRPFQEAPLSPLGLADYAVLRFAGVRVEAEPDDRGHFTFSYPFDAVRPGEGLTIRADVYQQRGRRDYMRVFDQWVKSDSPSETPDRWIAFDAIRIEFHQPVFEFRLERGAAEWRFDTARIDIRLADGSTRTALPNAAGRLEVGPPDASGARRLRYPPAAGEANVTGTTQATLTIEDAAGNVRRVDTTARTP
ncbi:MAG: hypothetical protein C4547_00890 [Phycisphaerales bacterium]|nr:MAG: hypothetical protein C4547_00890 [Phycisphaerales bacterium]